MSTRQRPPPWLILRETTGWRDLDAVNLAPAESGSVSRSGARSGGFGGDIELRARGIVADRRRTGVWDSAPASVLVREIALTLQQLDRTRRLYRLLIERFLHMDARLSTDLNKAEDIAHAEKGGASEARELRSRLLQIEGERHKLVLSTEQRVANLHDKLLSLLNRHALLAVPRRHDRPR